MDGLLVTRAASDWPGGWRAYVEGSSSWHSVSGGQEVFTTKYQVQVSRFQGRGRELRRLEVGLAHLVDVEPGGLRLIHQRIAI